MAKTLRVLFTQICTALQDKISETINATSKLQFVYKRKYISTDTLQSVYLQEAQEPGIMDTSEEEICVAGRDERLTFHCKPSVSFEFGEMCM